MRESPGQRTEETVIKTPKRTQHCTICKNHDAIAPKKGHNCPYFECTCRLCTLTRKSQMAMRHQQRVWRHQKQKLKSQKFDDEEAHVSNSENRSNKSQACDKCRNHNKLKLKRNHQCPFQECGCPFCSLTFKRRELMKHQQRVRRSRITSEVELESGVVPSSLETKDGESEYIHYRQKDNERSDKSDDDREISRQNRSDLQPIQESENMSANTENRVPAVPVETLTERSFSSVETRSPPHQMPILHSTVDIQLEPDGKLKRGSPPPLIHVRSHHSSPLQPYPRNSRSVSPQIHFDHSIQPNDSSSVLYQFDPFPEEPKEDVHRDRHRVVSQNGDSSPSLRSFPLRPSQLLQNTPRLCNSNETSMDPMKFGAQLQDLRIRNSSWLPPPLTGSSLENISSRSPVLRPQQERHSLELLHPHTELQRPIRPLPLNVSSPHHSSGPFSEHMWNRMVLSFNLGLQQHIPGGPRLEGFHGTLQTPGFNSRNIFHTA